ncbi:ArsR/SmtB family transcription factor [Terrihabitans sp. B22-R8]|uniref:ArsR/SmtB family transcription factor n=1 Tax=Terrihabitans sp. B22-R8 TaxID=3425128 RepID=UPI00403C1DC5
MSKDDYSSQEASPLRDVLAGLRAAGEPTRLRLLALLADGELNVTDLTEILGQSQPRISRHLKLLAEAGLIERQREGSWAFFRLANEGPGAGLARDIVARIAADEPALLADQERMTEVRGARDARAAAYFSDHAQNWNTIRALHVEEAAVEAAIREAAGPEPIRALLDIGTGTGRMIEVLGPQADRITGLDMSPDMLAVARSRLAQADLGRAQLRQGDIYALPVPAHSFDFVVIHQVLHFLEDPARAVRQAARAVAPGGRLLIVDFAPHELEFLREAHAHRRLGFATDVVEQWLRQAGLEPCNRRDLAAPDSARDKLTVSLWLARDPRIITDLPPLDPNRSVA